LIPNFVVNYPEDGHDGNWNMVVMNSMW